MKITVSLLMLAVLLTACHDVEEERTRLAKSLPEGCTFQDLGRYGDARQVLVVTCDGRVTRSTTSNRSSGKTSRDSYQIQVGEPAPEQQTEAK